MNKKRNSTQSFEFGKVPPQAIEMEEVILGALMLEKTAIERIENILPKDCFYKEEHNFIYNAIYELNSQRKHIDLMTVTEQVRKNGNLDAAGGMFYIAQLTNKIASSAHIESHSYIVLEKFIRRQLIFNQSEIQNAAFDDSIDLENVENVLSMANKSIDKINDLSAGESDSQHIRDIARKCMTALEERVIKSKEGIPIGVPTGFDKLDEATTGWQPGELIILAARPAMGKTAIMLHHAREAAKAGKSICIYSLEMTSMSLTDRMIVSIADIDAHRYKSGQLRDDEFLKIEKAIREIEEMNIYIDDNSSVSMKYVRSHSRKMKKKGKCDMIMLDYLQLVGFDNSYNKSREEKIAGASRDGKNISKELNVPVMILAQLSRDVEKRAGDKRPVLSDLRESGAIEQDADMVIFIHRPNYYGINQDADGTDISDIGKLIIAKFRNGTPDDIKFKHNKTLTRFVGEGEELLEDNPF